jgi:nitrate/nitrite transport system permease protein
MTLHDLMRDTAATTTDDEAATGAAGAMPDGTMPVGDASDVPLVPADDAVPAGLQVPEPPDLPPGPSRVRRAVTVAGWSLVGLVVFLLAWQLASAHSPDLPTPGETFTEMRKLLADPFYDNGPNDKGILLRVGESVQRVFKGFTMAALVGIPVGLLIGASRRAWLAVNPVVQLLRPVSPLAWYPIFLTVLASPLKAGPWVIFVTALWPIVLNTAAGVAEVPQDHKDIARVFRFGRVAYLRHVLIPDSLPSIVVGLRVSMGIAWMVIVAVEMLAGGSGIGSYVWTEYNALNIAHVICAILIIGTVGLILDFLFLRLARAVARQEAHV